MLNLEHFVSKGNKETVWRCSCGEQFQTQDEAIRHMTTVDQPPDDDEDD